MRESLETVDGAESLALLLDKALRQRRAQHHTSRLRVMRESCLTVARVAPVDEVTALAAGLNRLDRTPEDSEVVFTDRWAAAALMGRADAF
ncbi:hypothetical protein [Kitasatospora sp. NBC_01302]|uniref:hypothetical protein n=1 Tax=Kitasatospora sp. NBC_01302 TaxID=2903575 RepID=UPI002E1344AF|nr:hypothetical protein OG294_40940 [Kitasatospora sp. NBC_01302]